MMTGQEENLRPTSGLQDTATPQSMNHTPSSRLRLSSSSSHLGSNGLDGGAIELVETPQRSHSVGSSEHTSIERQEVESWSPRRTSLELESERHHVPLALRRSLLQRSPRSETGSGNAMAPSEGLSPSTLRMSRTSSLGFSRPESPYQGATGPSHPYGMYAQDIGVSRAPSSATATTLQRPERTYSGPRGPTQPYGMYPQNTVEEDEQSNFETTLAPAPMAYPAGARPAPQPHHRRLGPDGEDLDDLVGPDGYAEQLPPYSRYPNDIPPKRDPDASSFVNGEASASTPHRQSPNDQAQSPGPVTSATFIPTSDPTPYSEVSTTNVTLHGSNPSNDSTRNPANPHITLPDDNSPGSAPDPSSPQSNPFSDTSTQGSSTAVGSSNVSEKGSLKKRIRKRANKRCCWGIVPCWVIVFIVALILAVCVGGLLGGLLAHDTNNRTNRSNTIKSGANAELQPTVTVTSIVPAQTPDDAEAISTPSGAPPIPTGAFSVTLDEPSTTSNSCLTDALQNNAWDCSTGASLNVTIALQNNAPYITLTYPARPGQIQYGAQPPQLTGPSSLIYMRDKSPSGLSKGNSYGFKQPFNKTVIVRSQDFPGAFAKRSLSRAFRRWLNDEYENRAGNGWISGRQVQQSDWNMTSLASITDKPWVCTWNGTFLNGFIYVSTSVTQQLQYPKALKILEKRPLIPPIPATCQQMQIRQDWSLVPLLLPNGRPNVVPLTEQSGMDDEGDTSSASKQQVKRQADDGQIGGPRCECAWEST